MSKRRVIVDDTSSRIDYVGRSWFPDKGSLDDVGQLGPPWQGTLHGSETPANLTFSFNGTSVAVYGTKNDRKGSTDNLAWECFVDNIKIDSYGLNGMPGIQNRWLFCGHKQWLVDGPHTLTVNVTVAQQQTFWFDSIHYTPSPSALLDNETVYVESDDPALEYQSGWTEMEDIGWKTNKINATLEFEFTGISLAWYSAIYPEDNGNSTTCTYTLDDGFPQNIPLAGHPADVKSPLWNQKIFETPTVPMGRHKFKVVYDGNTNTTPLSLDHLIIRNGSTPLNTTSPSNPTGPRPSNTTTTITTNIITFPLPWNTAPISNTIPDPLSDVSKSGSVNKTALAGGVAAAVGILAILGALLFFHLRRQTKRNELDCHPNLLLRNSMNSSSLSLALASWGKFRPWSDFEHASHYAWTAPPHEKAADPEPLLSPEGASAPLSFITSAHDEDSQQVPLLVSPWEGTRSKPKGARVMRVSHTIGRKAVPRYPMVD